MASPSLPSTLTGPPVAALVPPKMCQFTADFTAVPLLQSFKVSDTTSVFRFGLPDAGKPLNLSTCACLLASYDDDNGECIVRPYTPISTNADVGYFDLLVKHYGPQAKMSRHLHDVMQVGDKLNFKHIDFSKLLCYALYRQAGRPMRREMTEETGALLSLTSIS